MSKVFTTPAFVWRHKKDLLGKKGIIKFFSRLHSSPAGIINRTPYYIAVIQVNGLNKNMIVEVCRENDQDVKIGGSVVLVHRKRQVSTDGLILYTLKAKVL